MVTSVETHPRKPIRINPSQALEDVKTITFETSQEMEMYELLNKAANSGYQTRSSLLKQLDDLSNKLLALTKEAELLKHLSNNEQIIRDAFKHLLLTLLTNHNGVAIKNEAMTMLRNAQTRINLPFAVVLFYKRYHLGENGGPGSYSLSAPRAGDYENDTRRLPVVGFTF